MQSAEEIAQNVANASRGLSAMLPGVEHAAAALRRFGLEMHRARQAHRPFHANACGDTPRFLSLRLQAKRKGRPGWRHIS